MQQLMEGSSTWKYDDKFIRQGLDSSTFRVDKQQLKKDYLSWLDQSSVVKIVNSSTNDWYKKLSPKRGNIAYARRQLRKIQDLEIGFRGLQLDCDVYNSRENHKDCLGLFVTFTYDQKKIECQDAWANISSDLAKWKIKMKRILNLNSIVSITVKEGTKSGYPAPHMFILLDRPLRSFKYHGKWRVQSNQVVQRLKSKWMNGNIDVQTIVSNHIGKQEALQYMFKYLTKKVEVKDDLAAYQMAFQKLFHLHGSLVSRAMKSLENTRLDNNEYKSQQQEVSNWKFDTVEHCNLDNFWKYIAGIEEFNKNIIRNYDYDKWRHKKWKEQSANLN